LKITNDSNLPDSVFQWILKVQGEYTKGDADISVTELINPPRIRILKKKYYDRIQIDASSLLNVTVGNTIHRAIEDATKTGTAERRLDITVLGWKLSGGMDHYFDGTLTDYKTANKWKTVLSNDGRIEEWEKQLNVYAHILREHGHPVSDLQIWAYFKDWNKGEFGQYSKKGQVFRPNLSCGYPEREWLNIPLELWDAEKARAYVEERVKLHQEAEKALSECPKEDLWGGRRCKDYCPVNFVCEQYQSTIKEKS
jgi:hypothetical protein